MICSGIGSQNNQMTTIIPTIVILIIAFTLMNLSLLIKSKPLQKSCGDIDCICDCE